MKAFSSYAVVTVAAFGVICPCQVSQAAATIVIVNGDNPNQGFNDTTPATPFGGNAGITLGQQRLIAFKYGAVIWGAALDGSVAVSIQSTFEPLTCTADRGVLAVAGPTIACAHPTFPIPNVWYPGALGMQLVADCTASNPPIRARFNSAIGSADCLQGASWYYGLDGNGGAAPIDLVDVVLHEFAHGLGFLTLTDTATGRRAQGSDGVARPDVWEFNLYDLTAAKHWSMMTDAERAASAVRPRKLVWDGPNVVSVVPTLLAIGTPSLTVNSPPSIAGEYLAGEARFGPPLTMAGVSGPLNAPVGLTTGCTAFSLPPASVALLDRGVCTFVTKVKNAQNAGAVAVVIADNLPDSPPDPMSGTDPTINIPAVRITQSDGALLKQQLASGVMVNERLLPARRGADDANHALLYTPDPYKPGSSVAHTDPIAGLLMDPRYNALLGHKLDLTPYLLKDIGWPLGNPNPQDQSADIALTLMPPSRYKKGSTVNYGVTVENKGPSNAGEVLVFSTAPSGVTHASNSGDCVSSFPCSLGAMPVGTRKAFIASYSVSSSYSGDDALLQLTINAAAPLPDPVLSNNVATATTPQSGGCSSAGFAEPLMPAALLLLAMRRRRRSSRV